jgi:thymidylate synthase
MKQFIDLCNRVIDEGEWVYNERTKTNCLTVINADLEYDASSDIIEMTTTKKLAWKVAIGELLGYLRGYDSAAQFRALGCKTWDANANENEAWLKNPARKGVDSLGSVYGVQGRGWISHDGTPIDQLKKVVDNLSKGIDDRREIVTYWNPGEMDLGCLAPCMHTYTYSLLGNKLYLTVYQRGMDIALGGSFNAIQSQLSLKLMARITNNIPMKVFHKVVNAHIYEDQLSLMRDVQLKREPRSFPRLIIDERIKTLEDLETWVTPDHFYLEGYDPHPAIKYPFSV